MTFHNAYNFVPAPHRPTRGSMAECEPVGHDHLGKDLVHGRLQVTMTTQTPLVVGEYAPPAAGTDHRTIHVQSRSGHQGAVSGADVHIPATSIKGMLRAAFEAATLSRFGVFDRHDIPLTYRAQAPQALGLVPVRVTGSPGAWRVTPMLGSRTDLADSGPLAAAMLPDEQVRHLIFAPNGLDRLRGIAHGSQERVTLCLVTRHGTPYWVVTHVNGDLCLDPADDIVVWDDGGGRIEIDVDGWVCRTNPGVLHYPPRPVVPRKHDERLFFEVHPQQALAVSPEVEARYCSVLESIRERAQGPQAAAIPTRLTAMLVQGLTGPELQDGDLLYAVFEGGRIRELVPSMIGRRTFDLAPRVLAEGAGLLPATSRGEASVADRVFGMVADPVAMVPEEEVTGDRSADRLAHRGQVVISAVEPVEVNLSETAKVLREQGAPKPSAARFYVRADSEGAALMRDRQMVKSRMYVKGQSLGRKVYPHHRDLDLDSDGFPAGAIDSGGANNRNVTVTSWVKAGSTFTFTIDFHNLTFFEIGALVWLLSPQQLAPPGTQACGYHRLGRGRGLGLGSVRLEATSLQLELTTSISKNYRELKGCLGWGMTERDLMKVVHSFTGRFGQASGEDFDEHPVIRSLRRAFAGYEDEVAVAYPARPRAGNGPQVAGPTVAWFTANEGVSRKHGIVELQHGYPLPSLADEPSTALPDLA